MAQAAKHLRKNKDLEAQLEAERKEKEEEKAKKRNRSRDKKRKKRAGDCGLMCRTSLQTGTSDLSFLLVAFVCDW
ncbi:hypothetical protein DPEC_G00264550 [Dallia pectoralis]|uniref:Uncharacterized protein n=1 Tax=Dallia pectoralis TaxID=75939 RepID=A0ACC2FST7_DALPE|nr:hypothetical protein DPEC_G00264550 [Dallia pectoralis]